MLFSSRRRGVPAGFGLVRARGRVRPVRGGTRARLVAATAAVVAAACLAAVTAAPAQAAVPRVEVDAGRTQPVFSYADAIREHVSVETPVDSDGDGRRDRAGIDLVRPRETERGLKVPAIMDNSPYFDNVGRGNEAETKSWDAAGNPAKLPLFYDNYFVPRGYAVLLVDMIGTTGSDGCPTTGGTPDVAAGKAAVDWLNGRAKAYRRDGTEARATWSTGKAGMIGKSYDGTLPNAVAATGVEGLETIVPISAISSWYGYTRMNGMKYYNAYTAGLAARVDTDPPEKCAHVRAGLSAGEDDATGNFNPFWRERDYIAPPPPDAGRVRASVFAVHTVNDLNVKPDHLGAWWDALGRRGVPRKLWLGQYHHVDPFDFRREEWVDTLHRWFDHWLQGVDNGIMTEPAVDVQTGPRTWSAQRAWPARGLDLALRPGPDAALGLRPAAPGTTGGFVDARLPESAMVADPTAPHPNRLGFVTPPLRRAVRVSGTPRVELRAALDRPTANLTALLVDYGEDTRVDAFGPEGGIRTLTEESCHGESTAADDACYRRTETVTATAPLAIIARGWLDAQNRHSPTDPEPLRPGSFERIAWRTLPHDYVLKPGHRLGLILAGTDGTYTGAESATGAAVTVDLAGSRVAVPVTLAPGEEPSAFTAEPGTPWRGPVHVDLPTPSIDFR